MSVVHQHSERMWDVLRGIFSNTTITDEQVCGRMQCDKQDCYQNPSSPSLNVFLYVQVCFFAANMLANKLRRCLVTATTVAKTILDKATIDCFRFLKQCEGHDNF